MTRKRLGMIDRESISIMRNVAEQTAAERRGVAISKAPPIGQVAGSAARSIEEEVLKLRQERDGLKSDASAYHAARGAGLVQAGAGNPVLMQRFFERGGTDCSSAAGCAASPAAWSAAWSAASSAASSVS